MKTALIIGVMWAGACFFVLWLNHCFHRYYSTGDDQAFSPEADAQMEDRERAADPVH